MSEVELGALITAIAGLCALLGLIIKWLIDRDIKLAEKTIDERERLQNMILSERNAYAEDLKTERQKTSDALELSSMTNRELAGALDALADKIEKV